MDKKQFFSRLVRAREDGLRRLAQAGPQPDEILARELDEPGADTRFGVSLVALPPPNVIAAARAIQGRLRAREPELYLYPSDDLHLVVLEILSEGGEDEAAGLARALRDLLPRLLDGLGPFRLLSPLFHFDERTSGMSFLPEDGALDRLRAALLERLAQNGVRPHRASRQSYLVLARYVAAPRAGRREWLELLSQTLVPSELAWEVPELYLISGVTTYGISARIERMGPYRLRSTGERE